MKLFLIFISFVLGLIQSKKISGRAVNKISAYFCYFIIETAKIIIPYSINLLYIKNNSLMITLILISLISSNIYPLVPIYSYAPIIPYFIGNLILSPKVFIILILIYISASFILKEYLSAFLIVSALSPFIFIVIEKSIPLFIFGMLTAGLFYLKYYFSKL